jgi:hypothetical protein
MAGECSHPSWNTVSVGSPEGFKTWCHSHHGFVNPPEPKYDRFGRRVW